MSEIIERNCLEAELVLGYKYYEQKDGYTKKVVECKKQMDTLNGLMFAERNQYVARRDSAARSSTYALEKHPEWKREYDELCDKQHAEVQRKEMDAFKQQKTYDLKLMQGLYVGCIVLGIVFAVLTILFNILAASQHGGDYGKAFQEGGLVSVSVFMGIFSALFFVGFTKAREAATKVKDELSSFQSTKKANVNSLDWYVFQKLTDSVRKELGQEYDKDHQAEIDAFAKKEAERKAEIEQKQRELSVLSKTERALFEYGQYLLTKVNVIPPYYFKADAIEKMLFFYVNKRADNIRDLINLYETTVFQEAVLKSLKDIAVSVDRLSETVRGSFNRLGLQLGVINESILENTREQRLNREKLSEIKDDNARHYMEMVDAMSEIEVITNTHVTVHTEQ